MNHKILILSTMYSGYLESFYSCHTAVTQYSYQENYNILTDEATEFVGSYTRGFRKLGLDVDFIVANDKILQQKWLRENNIKDRHNILFHQVKSFSPEILWIDNLSLVDRNWVKEIRSSVKSIRLIAGYHCSPYGARILDTLREVDIVFTCTPGIKEDLENNGLRTFLTYHAFDDLILKNLKVKNYPENDIVFSGSLISGARFHDLRIKLIEDLLKADVRISLYGNLEKGYKIKTKQSIHMLYNVLNKVGLEKISNAFSFFEHGKSKTVNYSDLLLKSCHDPVYGTEMYELFINSKVVLNMHIGVAGEYAGNMRIFEVTGAGSCLLTDNKKNLRDLYEPDYEIVSYDNTEDCINKAKWLMDHGNERTQIAEAGHKRTLKYHTVENRCIQMKAILEDELKRRFL